MTIDDSSFLQFIADSFRFIIAARRMKIDAVVDCELFARISSILSFCSGATLRAGFHPYHQEGLYRGGFINRPVAYNPYHHISRQFVMLADALSSDTVPGVKAGAFHRYTVCPGSNCPKQK